MNVFLYGSSHVTLWPPQVLCAIQSSEPPFLTVQVFEHFPRQTNPHWKISGTSKQGRWEMPVDVVESHGLFATLHTLGEPTWTNVRSMIRYPIILHLTFGWPGLSYRGSTIDISVQGISWRSTTNWSVPPAAPFKWEIQTHNQKYQGTGNIMRTQTKYDTTTYAGILKDSASQEQIRAVLSSVGLEV